MPVHAVPARGRSARRIEHDLPVRTSPVIDLLKDRTWSRFVERAQIDDIVSTPGRRAETRGLILAPCYGTSERRGLERS